MKRLMMIAAVAALTSAPAFAGTHHVRGRKVVFKRDTVRPMALTGTEKAERSDGPAHHMRSRRVILRNVR